jgi:DNA-binding PadR family transcriptional regulator
MDEFSWKVLSVVARRGYLGASREDFFSEIRGVQYRALEDELRALEEEGNIEIEWTGPNKFIVTITSQGSQMISEEYKKRLESYEKKVEDQEAPESE